MAAPLCRRFAMRTVLRFALAVACALAPNAARACSICGCDPSGGALGLERPDAGDLRLSFETRYLEKQSGDVSEPEGEKEARTILRAQCSPIAHLSASLEVPVYLWKAHFNGSGAQDDHASGLSDVQLGARYELLRIGELIPDHIVALTLSLKAPTGQNARVAAIDEGVPDEHKQLGAGSWDWMPGALYTWNLAPTTVYAGVQGRLNGANARGFRYGNAIFGTLGVRQALLEERTLYVSLEAQLRDAGYDRGGEGIDPSSGGFLGYANLGIGYQLTPEFVIRGTAQIPVASRLHGVQCEHVVGLLGIAYDITP